MARRSTVAAAALQLTADPTCRGRSAVSHTQRLMPCRSTRLSTRWQTSYRRTATEQWSFDSLSDSIAVPFSARRSAAAAMAVPHNRRNPAGASQPGGVHRCRRRDRHCATHRLRSECPAVSPVEPSVDVFGQGAMQSARGTWNANLLWTCSAKTVHTSVL